MTDDDRPQGHDDDRHCGARTRSGGLCGQPAGWATSHPGTGNCKLHGGSTPTGQKHGERLAVQRRVSDLLAEHDIDAADVDPLEELIGVLRRARAMTAVLGRLVGELDAAGGRAFVFHGDDGFGYEPASVAGMYGPDHKGDGRPHALMALYGEWTDRLGRVTKLAIDAGIDERRVRLAERHAEELAAVVRAVAAGVVDDFATGGAAPELVSAVRQGLGGTMRRAIEQTGDLIETTATEDPT